MDKKQLSEIDICEKFISPAMAGSGWNIHDQIFHKYPLHVGCVTVRCNKSHRDQSTVLRTRILSGQAVQRNLADALVAANYGPL